MERIQIGFNKFYKVIYRELAKEGFLVTLSGVKRKLLEHPNYPSIQTIVDYFADMDIACSVVRINFEQLQDSLTEAVAIVLVKEDNHDNLLWIKNIDASKVYYVNNKSDNHEIFQTKWIGTTLLLQIDKVKEEKNYIYNKKNENDQKKYLSVFFGGLLCLSFSFIFKQDFPVFSFLTLLPKYGGILFSFLLITIELGLKTPLSEKLCSISTNKGCEKVTTSRIASISKNIKLSDLALIYFISTFLYQIVGDTMLLSYVSLLCIPIILISIYYQTFILKAFCPLCMGVITMLGLDIIVYFSGGLYNELELIDLYDLLIFAGISSLLMGGWLLMKQTIMDRNSFQNFQYFYQRLFRDPVRLRSLLNNQPDVNIKVSDCDIVLGDKAADFLLTEVISPFCSPCGNSIQKIIGLLNTFPSGIQIRICFTDSKGEKEKNLQIITHLLSFAKENDDCRIIEALIDWFDKMDYSIWSRNYSLKSCSLLPEDILSYLKVIKTYDIKYTPTLFINNKRVPSELGVSDLRYYIDDEICIE
ncbi:MAG: vitamin K epoxide reductase family protein [Tannerellaceae bacterium]|jgi:uncharacterized membrane protein|nr:vitamin K epoxide reductase family protein [Tannerellaceae bacterium]